MNKRKTICYTASALLALGAVGVFGYQHADGYIARSYRPRVTKQMIARGNSRKAHVTYNEKNVEPVDTSEELHQQGTNEAVLGQMVLGGTSLHLPITAGTGSNLLNSAGTESPRQKMGRSNYVLFGHHMRSDCLFTPLVSSYHRGQRVYITDDRTVYEYQLDSRATVDEHDMSVLDGTSEPTISLITCEATLGGTNRYDYTGHLVKKYPMRRAPRALAKDFSDPTNNHDVLKGY